MRGVLSAFQKKCLIIVVPFWTSQAEFALSLSICQPQIKGSVKLIYWRKLGVYRFLVSFKASQEGFYSISEQFYLQNHCIGLRQY